MSAVGQTIEGSFLRAAFLEQVPLFGGLSRAQRAEVAARGRDHRIPRRQFFFQEGEPAVEICVLFAGRAKLTRLSQGGEEVILSLLGPTEAFGALGLVVDGSHTTSAQALEPSHALVWERRVLEDLFERVPLLQRNALRIMAARLRSLEERYRELATEKVPQRLARALLRLLDHIGRPAPNGVLIALSREDLAQIIATTLFTVSRLLSHWETRGIVGARREAVVVSDPARLLEIAEDNNPTDTHD